MKKAANLVLLAIFITIASLLPAFAINIPTSEELNNLLTERQIDCWVEGEAFDQLVLGARGSIQFIYLDAKLSKAISQEQGLASWVDELNQYYGSQGTEKKALFIAQLEANKPWTVEEGKISVNGYHLDKKDIISTSWKNPFGTIDPGSKWQFAFVVPRSEVKKGAEINVGYGDDLVKWRVPK